MPPSLMVTLSCLTIISLTSILMFYKVRRINISRMKVILKVNNSKIQRIQSILCSGRVHVISTLGRCWKHTCIITLVHTEGKSKIITSVVSKQVSLQRTLYLLILNYIHLLASHTFTLFVTVQKQWLYYTHSSPCVFIIRAGTFFLRTDTLFYLIPRLLTNKIQLHVFFSFILQNW